MPDDVRCDAVAWTEQKGPSPSEAVLTPARKDRGIDASGRDRAAYWALMAGWRGRPLTAWFPDRPAVHRNYARGLERRRTAMQIGVWYPGRDRPFVATNEERRAARLAVASAIRAKEEERKRLDARALRNPPGSP